MIVNAEHHVLYLVSVIYLVRVKSFEFAQSLYEPGTSTPRILIVFSALDEYKIIGTVAFDLSFISKSSDWFSSS